MSGCAHRHGDGTQQLAHGGTQPCIPSSPTHGASSTRSRAPSGSTRKAPWRRPGPVCAGARRRPQPGRSPVSSVGGDWETARPLCLLKPPEGGEWEKAFARSAARLKEGGLHGLRTLPHESSPEARRFESAQQDEPAIPAQNTGSPEQCSGTAFPGIRWRSCTGGRRRG